MGWLDISQEKEAEIEKLETDFKAFVDGLQKQYSEASEKKDADTEVADAGFGIWHLKYTWFAALRRVRV